LNDQGKKDGEKNLSKTWLVSKDLIQTVLDKDGAIEDVLTKSDFQKYVLKQENSYSETNSELITKQKSDKVLLSRLFLQSIENDEVTLSDESLKNIELIFDKISRKI